MNLVWDVPLAVVLAIVSFFIGFLPIVGSWAHVPVALYLIVFRGDVVGRFAMATIGFTVNTILLSLYLRPKIAAESRRCSISTGCSSHSRPGCTFGLVA